MRVRVIAEESASDLEYSINEWITNHEKDIQVIRVQVIPYGSHQLAACIEYVPYEINTSIMS